MAVLGTRPRSPGRSLGYEQGVRARYDAALRRISTGSLVAILGLVTFWWVSDGGITDLAG